MRLVHACELAGGRSASSAVARRFHRVLAVTSEDLPSSDVTASNCATGRRRTSVGRSVQPKAATAMKNIQPAEYRVLDIVTPPSHCEKDDLNPILRRLDTLHRRCGLW